MGAVNGRWRSPFLTRDGVHGETGQLSLEFTAGGSISSCTRSGQSKTALGFQSLSTRAVPYVPRLTSLLTTASTRHWLSGIGGIHWKTLETATSVGGRLPTIKAHQR